MQCCGAGGGGGAPGATLFLMEVLMEVEVKKRFGWLHLQYSFEQCLYYNL